MTEHIYALYHYANQIDEKIYFYVGHTIDPDRRFNEHCYNVNSNKKTEDVYAYIRSSCLGEIFHMDVLCEVLNKDDPYEDFWVIEMIRAGYELQNMKHGDEKMMALNSEANELSSHKIKIESPKELRVYREGERARKLRDKVLASGEVEAPANSIDFSSIPKIQTTKKKRDFPVSEAQHQKWLSEQRRLFEDGRIDALGNRIGE